MLDTSARICSEFGFCRKQTQQTNPEQGSAKRSGQLIGDAAVPSQFFVCVIAAHHLRMHRNARCKLALFCDFDHANRRRRQHSSIALEINQLLTKLVYQDIGHLGAQCAGL
jgi:hypothetical protein